MKPRLLDLFCCEGGAARGYQLAGFYVVGVDDKRRRRYCGDEFIQADALTLDPAFLASFDAIHASPPCQFATSLRHAPNGKEHPNHIPATRDMLIASGLPYIIENVEDAAPWLRDPLLLCGSMFGLGHTERGVRFRLERHRLFESNLPLTAPGLCAHAPDEPVIGIYGGHARNRSRKHGGRGTRDDWEGGHRPPSVAAMGMPWATLNGMSEAIPPAYTEHLGRQLIAHLQAQRAAT